MQRIDINCDMGEMEGEEGRSLDRSLMPFISSCNIACGFHAGDEAIMEATIREAIMANVAIGAHPSFDDRANFGRKEMDISPENLQALVRQQVMAMQFITASLGGRLNHVKPHGALYNQLAKARSLSEAFVACMQSLNPDLIIYGLAGSILEQVCIAQNVPFFAEGFADRRYESNGQLRSRTLPNAVIENEAELLAQLADMVLHNRVQSIDGKIIPLKVNTICLHSDTPHALARAKSIYHFLREQKIDITAAL